MGLRRLSPFVVELPSGERVVMPPPFPFGDCRFCSLIGWICEDLEYPCRAVTDACPLRDRVTDCMECEHREECLERKPCCWECRYLMDCLEMSRDWGADDFVRDVYGVEWGEFVEAVKALREG